MPGKNRRRLALLVALITSPVAVNAQDAAAAIATDGMVFDEHKVIGFPKPVDWKVSDLKSEPVSDIYRERTTVLEFKARTVKFETIHVRVTLLNRSFASEKLQAMTTRDGTLQAGWAHEDKYEMSTGPIAYGLYRPKDYPNECRILVHRRSSGREMTVVISMMNSVLDKAKDTMLGLANKVVCKASLWPKNEPGYDFEPESGIQIAFKSSISKKFRKKVHKVVKDTVKDFTKRHGAPRFVEGEPVVLYVNDDDGEKGKLLFRPKAVPHGYNYEARRIVTSVLDGNWDGYCWCTGHIYRYLLETIYPAHGLYWVLAGEEAIARSKVYCKKALPSIPASWFEDMKLMRMTLAELDATKTVPPYADVSAWAAYFRIGPTKHRKAYEKLIVDLRTTEHPRKVMDAFYKTVGADSLRPAARKLIKKKLKPIRKT